MVSIEMLLIDKYVHLSIDNNIRRILIVNREVLTSMLVCQLTYIRQRCQLTNMLNCQLTITYDKFLLSIENRSP